MTYTYTYVVCVCVYYIKQCSLIHSLTVLWNEKRGHQLVPLKHIKEAPTLPLFMLCQQNCACMQNGTSTISISNLD